MNGLIDAHLSNLALFVRVADAGGFTAAAKLTKTPQASVSRRIALLEDTLGVRLFNRTTRSVAVTEAGRRVYQHAKLMLEQGEAASIALQALQGSPSGTLNITGTVVLGHYFLSDLTARFMRRFPDVSIRMELTGRRVDIVEEGYDIALRVGSLPDSGLALTRIKKLRTGLYASPDYIKSAPKVTEPEHLSTHPILAFAKTLDPFTLRLSKKGTSKKPIVQPIFSANDAQPVLTAAAQNLGIAILPQFVGETEVTAGRLEPILANWKMPETELNALTPSFKGEVPAVKEFLKMAKFELQSRP